MTLTGQSLFNFSCDGIEQNRREPFVCGKNRFFRRSPGQTNPPREPSSVEPAVPDPEVVPAQVKKFPALNSHAMPVIAGTKKG
jgi:hypothetical protein